MEQIWKKTCKSARQKLQNILDQKMNVAGNVVNIPVPCSARANKRVSAAVQNPLAELKGSDKICLCNRNICCLNPFLLAYISIFGHWILKIFLVEFQVGAPCRFI